MAVATGHAHFLPGVATDKFIDAMDFSRCLEVCIANNNGSWEIHQQPGEGTIGFGALFAKIEGRVMKAITQTALARSTTCWLAVNT